MTKLGCHRVSVPGSRRRHSDKQVADGQRAERVRVPVPSVEPRRVVQRRHQGAHQRELPLPPGRCGRLGRQLDR